MTYYQIPEDPASPQQYPLENVGDLDSIPPLVKTAAVLIPKHILSGKGKQGMTNSLLPALVSCGGNEHLHTSTAGLLQPPNGVTVQSTVTQHQFCTLPLCSRVNKVLKGK